MRTPALYPLSFSPVFSTASGLGDLAGDQVGAPPGVDGAEQQVAELVSFTATTMKPVSTGSIEAVKRAGNSRSSNRWAMATLIASAGSKVAGCR